MTVAAVLFGASLPASVEMLGFVGGGSASLNGSVPQTWALFTVSG